MARAIRACVLRSQIALVSRCGGINCSPASSSQSAATPSDTGAFSLFVNALDPQYYYAFCFVGVSPVPGADFNDDVRRILASLIPRLDNGKYQGRTWATRRRLWVDRVASAWLIRRFIDRDARFRWLERPSDCPKSALGFDFDGATFTHVGDRVTFETLMASFGLEEDPALLRLASIVHALDVGGEPAPEAKGFEAVMAGARERLTDDDALLAEMSTVLDSLYAHFRREAQRGNDKGNTR